MPTTGVDRLARTISQWERFVARQAGNRLRIFTVVGAVLGALLEVAA